MDKVYEGDKILALTKATAFTQPFLLKKNRKLTWLCDKQLYKQRNIIE